MDSNLFIQNNLLKKELDELKLINSKLVGENKLILDELDTVKIELKKKLNIISFIFRMFQKAKQEFAKYAI